MSVIHRMVGSVASLVILFAGDVAAQQEAARERAIPLAFAHSGVRLQGWLELPQQARGAAPVIVLIPGNGAWRPLRPWLYAQADHWLSRGIGVFYYDHRGEGASSGSWTHSSFADLADDAVAAVRVVRRHPGVDSMQVGLWGHSMGGWIAPLAAARSSDIAFVITAAGPGVSPMIQNGYHKLMEDLHAGVPREHAIEMARLRRELALYLTYPTNERYRSARETLDWARRQSWFGLASRWQEMAVAADSLSPPAALQSPRVDSLLAGFRRDALYDPAPALEKVRVPMLALFGADDIVVSAEPSIAAMRQAFRVADVESLLTTQILDEADHRFLRRAFTGDPQDFSPQYLDLIATWVLQLPIRRTP